MTYIGAISNSYFFLYLLCSSHENLLGGMIIIHLTSAHAHAQSSYSLGLDQAQICIPNKLLCETDAPDPGSIIWGLFL